MTDYVLLQLHRENQTKCRTTTGKRTNGLGSTTSSFSIRYVGQSHLENIAQPYLTNLFLIYLIFIFLKTNAAMDLKCSIVDKKQNALNGIFQPLRVLGSYDIMIILTKLRCYIILCSDIRDCNMREFEEAVHGRLDLHLHRTCPHLCQPIQGFVFVFVFVFVLYLHLHRTCPQIKGFVVAVIVLVVIPEDSHCRSDYSNWLQITLLTFPPVNKHLKVLFFSSKLAKASLKHKDRGKTFFVC